MYTDDEWNNVLAFLNNEAEKPEPDGIGKRIETTEEFIEVIQRAEAIKPQIVASEALKHRREFDDLEKHKTDLDQSVIDVQDQIDNHPGNPGRP